MNLNYVLIGAPDKPVLKAFVLFIKKQLGRDYVLGDMHSLMSDEAKDQYITDFASKFSKGVIIYYAKKVYKSPEDPLLYLPKKAIDISEAIAWFDLYSVEPKILKDTENFFPALIDSWKKYIG